MTVFLSLFFNSFFYFLFFDFCFFIYFSSQLWAAESLFSCVENGAVGLCVDCIVSTSVNSVRELALTLLGHLVRVSEDSVLQMLRHPTW